MRFILLALIPFFVNAQSKPQPNAAEIKLGLKKLNFLGSVLYVAAHPDDENTRAITYFANERLAATAYLSMTRGDGGQNLIGPEIRDELGLIRTQELLAARRLDGGQQFFTRANDFGFSKSADETFAIWGKDQILEDVVRIYRQFQPDVIITRFPPDERAGHGHHTASAVLAQEAFDAAASKDRFTKQLSEYSTWQVKRLYTNTGRWWNQSINENTPGVLTLNVGGYSALLGTSYSELAAISRSQHKSQGFGSRGTRGDQLEFLEFVKGEEAKKDVFENVNTSWTRVKGGEKVQTLVNKVIVEYNEEKPEASVPVLIQIKQQIIALEKSVWRDRKLEEVNQLLQACLGLYLEATADHFWATPGNIVSVSIELLNRSTLPVSIKKLSATALKYDSTLNTNLLSGKTLNVKVKHDVESTVPYSSPYWLQEEHSIGTFTIPDEKLVGKPESDPAIQFTADVEIEGQVVSLVIPLIYKNVDPVKGELNRAVEVVPPVFVNLAESVIIFATDAPRQVQVVVKSSGKEKVQGNVNLRLPNGWRSEPASVAFELSKLGEEQTKSFTVYPAIEEGKFTLEAYAVINNKLYDKELKIIAYDHIPTQTILQKSDAALIRINLKKEGNTIGYIKGAGDDVPSALRNMGYEVWEMKDEEITEENLKRLDAVVLGIRAINTNNRLQFAMPALLDYVKNGGTLVMQYNTNFGYETDVFSPYPITLSRDRVTEEDALVTILKPEHPLLNYPNKISSTDFNDWVQERGLYFPNKWDAQFDALLSMNDKGEQPKEGSLLVANYGEGKYIYTGLSFFRELPEGVPGAYKLFANLVSGGKVKEAEPTLNVKGKKKSGNGRN
ncbi:PIG-L family deacetylase [Chryseotalea sanaruensis]|uniref:PIG-L family deacetylase n=1 Tax=Chryseotalea sanaruensis TaxID=2482724 RepID=A0A401U5U2_9BACT|nr:PIG-L family deacetylase [Chryseotalea sanaruensis]GCC50257.1 PIG-L family deacetylase [Chryseotalea sanaruensis]